MFGWLDDLQELLLDIHLSALMGFLRGATRSWGRDAARLQSLGAVMIFHLAALNPFGAWRSIASFTHAL